ncbi:hypothetical protein PAXRUDRAFT_824660 [Paxillus rubicundulus Ve08.2h10]|uniref:Uncharacterized protein n=1 Tax=Paxillus rubicundulus Ve08.2h10 TaxID=930991 RepID=A0A0D0E1I5_9AGAM|nr:hypothetical protein PAXRUDRAFT_824660 [Paxillus rubicundulus Ve08.2h10]
MAMGDGVWAGTGHMFKIDTHIECDTMSETDTLVDFSCETSDSNRNITTIFRDSNPANRQAVYQSYLAMSTRASLVESMDDVMLCPDNRAWECPSSRACQRAKRAMSSMLSWAKRLQKSSHRRNHSLSDEYRIERSLVTVHAVGQSY